MERRREHRISLHGDAKLKLLDSGQLTASANPIVLPAKILDISGSGMRIRVSRPIPCGALVQIDAGDTISLGEVCRCFQENNSSQLDSENTKHDTYSLGIQIKHTLASIRELERFSRLLDEYDADMKTGQTRRRGETVV